MELTLVEDVLESSNLQQGLNRYVEIMKCFQNTNVSTDREFQRKYTGFYRMRQRSAEYYNAYYDFMEKKRGTQITFEDVLSFLYEKFECYFASFSSKMVATINPNQPVWDQYVLQNIGLKAPTYSTKDRMKKTIETYAQIQEWYHNFLLTDDAKIMIRMFDEKFPNYNITDLKKIDLILWQMRG